MNALVCFAGSQQDPVALIIGSGIVSGVVCLMVGILIGTSVRR